MRVKNEKRQLIGPVEAARLTGVDIRTLARNADKGRLWSVRTLGGRRRYDREQIEQVAREINP
jgi:excisionase family DNA binding protein